MAMKFINTVLMDFGRPQSPIKPLTVHRFVRTLNVTNDQVEALYHLPSPSNQFLVCLEFKKPNEYIDFMSTFAGQRELPLHKEDGGAKIKVLFRDPNIHETFIRVNYVPLSMDLEVVKKRFGSFVMVNGIRWERYSTRSDSDDWFPCRNGWVAIRMDLAQSIPSYIQLGNTKVFVTYSGQPQTCRKCDESGHFAEECPKSQPPKRDERVKKPLGNDPKVKPVVTALPSNSQDGKKNEEGGEKEVSHEEKEEGTADNSSQPQQQQKETSIESGSSSPTYASTLAKSVVQPSTAESANVEANSLKSSIEIIETKMVESTESDEMEIQRQSLKRVASKSPDKDNKVPTSKPRESRSRSIRDGKVKNKNTKQQ